MRASILAVLLAATILPSTASIAQTAAIVGEDLEVERVKAAEELLTLAFPSAERQELFSGTAKQVFAMIKQNLPPSKDSGVQAIIDRRLPRLLTANDLVLSRHIPNLMRAIAEAYAREFSLEELQQYKAFAATPGGSHYFRRQTALLQDPGFLRANQAYTTDFMTTVVQPESEGLKQEIAEYLKKNPAALKRLSGN